ncbi:glycine/betaine ABC transporter [Aquibacillus halophilus]|uniref:Glycine/betaine ABC transporter n=1 Tax=Aquibacillus halophilus TaxID=930132 RepID=A0A6A8DIC3_9BACI|nr:glycine betaine ABC transporter substrate-binding protein [Aquibacillus halophilus]MRH43501.1 glycine/betaine ABC transporter [Aquibacillus halophilus]
MNLFKGKSILLLLSLIIVLAACGNNENNENGENATETETEQKSVHMGQINWAENIAVTNMWKVILEDRDYDVKFSVIDMGTTMKALENGELDLSLEIWLPVQDANYYETYKDDVNFSEEVWYDNAKVGLVVPAYMDQINSIEDLNEHKELFESQITGFDPGAGTMEVTEDLIEEYELDFELIPSSEPAMLTAIGEAIKNEEAIVSPLWNPHRIFAEHDLKYLEDPKNVYGGIEKIHHATRHGFEEDFPEFSQWLKNWKMTDDQIGTLMTEVEAAEEPIDGARVWVEENQDLINEWINE